MTLYRYSCDRCNHYTALADLVETRPAVYVCGDCIRRDDTARDQWAADTNITQPIPQDVRTRLNTWRAERTRQENGGKPSW